MCNKAAEWIVKRGNGRECVCTEHLPNMILKFGGIAHVDGMSEWPTEKVKMELCSWDDRELVKVVREKLERIAAEVVDLVMAKNADYGDAWQRQGSPGLVSRVADKMYRVDILADDGHEIMVVNESLRDTLIDGIGYCMLGLLYLEARQCQSTPAKPAD